MRILIIFRNFDECTLKYSLLHVLINNRLRYRYYVDMTSIIRFPRFLSLHQIAKMHAFAVQEQRLAHIFLAVCGCNTRSMPARWLRCFFTNIYICTYMPKIANLACVGENFPCSLWSPLCVTASDDPWCIYCHCMPT